VTDESDRFRMRARKCRDLAASARDEASRRELTYMGQELDDEADAIEADAAASKGGQTDPDG
jgi:hypothetical protein